MLQSLPNPYEVDGGLSPYLPSTHNLTSYDQYLQPLEGLSGIGDDENNWVGMFCGGLYGYLKHGAIVGAAGALTGLYAPRLLVVLVIAESLFQHSKDSAELNQYRRYRR